MNILKAEHILFSYPCAGGNRLSDVYDDDEQLREAVNSLFPGFEYPDHAHKTLAELWAQYAKKKLPLDRSASVFVLFSGGALFRSAILGDFQEHFYGIVPMSNGDLLIEYTSAYEFEAARVRLNGQVSMSVLTREEAAALAQTAVR